MTEDQKMCEDLIMNSIAGEGKIMTDQDLWAKQFHDDNVDNNYNIRKDIKLLSDKIAKLNDRIDIVLQTLKGQVTLGNNGTTLQTNGGIK